MEPPLPEVPPPAAQQAPPQPPPTNAYDRPRREIKKPAWMRSGDFDMEAAASTVRYCGTDESEAVNSVGGVSGHAEDDAHTARDRPAGQYEKSPPDGGVLVARAAAMLGDVVEVLHKLLALVANDSDVGMDQAYDRDGAVVKNGGLKT